MLFMILLWYNDRETNEYLTKVLIFLETIALLTIFFSGRLNKFCIMLNFYFVKSQFMNLVSLTTLVCYLKINLTLTGLGD